jgi:ABC-type molybdate transport system permease subunit
VEKIAMYIFFSCMLLILFCYAAPGWAYLDPGTGGVVFSALAYIIGAGAVAFGFLVRPIKRLFASIASRFKSHKENPIEQMKPPP